MELRAPPRARSAAGEVRAVRIEKLVFVDPLDRVWCVGGDVLLRLEATPAPVFRRVAFGTTSAALGKRAWNLKAIGIIDCAVAPQPCRKTNRWLDLRSGVGAKRKTRPEDIARLLTRAPRSVN